MRNLPPLIALIAPRTSRHTLVDMREANHEGDSFVGKHSSYTTPFTHYSILLASSCLLFKRGCASPVGAVRCVRD